MVFNTMTRMVVIRHGESESNRLPRLQGRADPPLTPEGHGQARRIDRMGRTLAAQGEVRLVASPLIRALASAELVAAVGANVGREI